MTYPTRGRILKRPFLVTSFVAATRLVTACSVYSVAAEPRPEDLAPKYGNAMIAITVSWPTAKGDTHWEAKQIGSGFFFGDADYALTATHVVSSPDLDLRCGDLPRTECPKISVRIAAMGETYEAQRVSPSGTNTDDVALLHVSIDPSKHGHIEWGNPFQERMGATLYALHFPNGEGMKFGKGGISTMFGPGAHWTGTLDNTDTGSSGCAVFNADLQTVGMLVEGTVVTEADIIPRNLFAALILSGAGVDSASATAFLSSLGWDPKAVASLGVDTASALVRYVMPYDLNAAPIVSSTRLWGGDAKTVYYAYNDNHRTFDLSPREGYELSDLKVSKPTSCNSSTVATWTKSTASVEVSAGGCGESGVEVKTVEIPSKGTDPIANILQRTNKDPAAKKSLEDVLSGKTASAAGDAWALGNTQNN